MEAAFFSSVVEPSVDPVIELEAQYLLQNYARLPVVLERGKGCYVYDTSGNRYLDLIAGIGVNALGYSHPRITKVIKQQAGRLIHSSNLYYHQYSGPLAERISKLSGLARVFFCNSGTEANEAALKMAKAHGRNISPDKFEIVALDNSFHGRTMGALSVTGQENYRRNFEPLIPGVHFAQKVRHSSLAFAGVEDDAEVLGFREFRRQARQHRQAAADMKTADDDVYAFGAKRAAEI